MSVTREIGTLVVVVLKARNLPDKHSLYKQDPYVVLTLGDVARRTSTDIKGGQHPVWDEEFRFPILSNDTEKHRVIQVTCWAKEPKGDDNLGTGSVYISETLRTGQFDDWVKLEYNSAYRGEVYLEMTFYANALPPPTRRPSKLAPKERLSRPTQPYYRPDTSSRTPPRPISNLPSSNLQSSPGHPFSMIPGAGSASTSPKGTHLVPPASRSPSVSPKTRDSGLLPSPGKTSSKPQHVPSILRPGNPKSATKREVSLNAIFPRDLGHSSPPLGEITPPITQYHPLNQTFLLDPASHYTHTPYPSAESARLPVYITPLPYSSSSQASAPPDAGHLFENHPVPPFSYEDYSTNDLPDPYVSARYQKPLPLPSVQAKSSPSLPKEPVTADTPEIRRLAEKPKRDNAAQRKAQELADLEFARKLDQELNLGDLYN